MNIERLDDIYKKVDEGKKRLPFTALLYCNPGVGKTTAIGLIAEQSKKKTLILDVDRTVERTLAKGEVVKDTSKIDVVKIDNINTFEDWSKTLVDLVEMKKSGDLDSYENIAVDNISELERCILSDLGSKGKNKGVPAMGDYQYMQFKLMNSLRYMKQLELNLIWTAWEEMNQYTHPDGTSYSMLYPKINKRVLENVCGLCDVVARISVNNEGKRGMILQATQNIYAKNQIDARKGCLVEDFIKFERGNE